MLRLRQRRLFQARVPPQVGPQEGAGVRLTPVGVLVSGRGSNLEAILNAIQRREVKEAQVKVVVSNRAGVRALEIAKEHGVPTTVLESAGHGGPREDYDNRLANALEERGVSPRTGLVLLAGFDRILSAAFVNRYAGRMMNIHPSLLPAFPGLHAQKQALDYGSKVAGCTVHFVSPEVDGGPIILQRAVTVLDGDTEESLSSRILKEEHIAYPEALELFVSGKLRIEGRLVRVSS